MNEMKLIAGLGNPGSEYKETRHNVGFETIDKLAKKLKVELNKEKFGAALGKAELKIKS
jgi:PTH1 family peptidyl-tRNA hydrolase